MDPLPEDYPRRLFDCPFKFVLMCFSKQHWNRCIPIAEMVSGTDQRIPGGEDSGHGNILEEWPWFCCNHPQISP